MKHHKRTDWTMSYNSIIQPCRVPRDWLRTYKEFAERKLRLVSTVLDGLYMMIDQTLRTRKQFSDEYIIYG